MIFIIGGAGFVGSAFVRELDARGLSYRVIEKENYDDFVGKSCDLLINANGNSKKYLANEDPVGDFDTSVRSVMASLVNFKYDFYLYLSSCDVYPDCSSSQSTLEDRALDPGDQSPYGFHKYLAEQCVRHFAKKWLIVRFGGFVGAGLRKNPIYDILHGGPLWLDPESELQFLDTDKAAKIVLGLVDAGHVKETFNVCGNGLIKLREVIDAAGCPVKVQPGSPSVRYDVNTTKLLSVTEVPSTRRTILNFVQAELQRGVVSNE